MNFLDVHWSDTGAIIVEKLQDCVNSVKLFDTAPTCCNHRYCYCQWISV